jgi:hypothetical protein
MLKKLRPAVLAVLHVRIFRALKLQRDSFGEEILKMSRLAYLPPSLFQITSHFQTANVASREVLLPIPSPAQRIKFIFEQMDYLVDALERWLERDGWTQFMAHFLKIPRRRGET